MGLLKAAKGAAQTLVGASRGIKSALDSHNKLNENKEKAKEDTINKYNEKMSRINTQTQNKVDRLNTKAEKIEKTPQFKQELSDDIHNKMNVVKKPTIQDKADSLNIDRLSDNIHNSVIEASKNYIPKKTRKQLGYEQRFQNFNNNLGAMKAANNPIERSELSNKIMRVFKNGINEDNVDFANSLLGSKQLSKQDTKFFKEELKKFYKRYNDMMENKNPTALTYTGKDNKEKAEVLQNYYGIKK